MQSWKLTCNWIWILPMSWILGSFATPGCAPAPGGSNGDANSNAEANGNIGGNENNNVAGNDNQSGTGGVVWGRMFDGNYTGALVSIWGADANNVFAVGGQPSQAEVYRFNGTQWQAMTVPSVPILAWVYGFAANDVYAVGENGGVIHYNGSSWTSLNSGTSEDLWCVWGNGPNDVWIVGGDNGDSIPPVILHYNGVSFTNVDPPANDRNASALYGVWGVEDRVWAVGSLGLIIERVPSTGVWAQVPVTGQSNQDYFSISGVSEDLVLAVGGNSASGARIARYDGLFWSVTEPTGVAGLNVVFALDEDEVLVGGPDGYVARYFPEAGLIANEDAGAFQSIRGIWSEGISGKYWVVGAIFSPFVGAGYLRTDDGVERFGEQPDMNEDGLPDAPLTVNGDRPDDITVPNDNSGGNANENDNMGPSVPTVVAGIEDATLTFNELADGDSIPFAYVPQPPGYQSQLAFRVTGFPDSILNQIGTFEYSVTAQSDGTVLGSQSTVGLFQSSSTDGAYIVRRGLMYSESDPAALEGLAVDLSVTITYDAVSPPVSATFTGSFTLFEQSN